MKCAHTVLPSITLVTSMNKSVLCDVLSILKIGRNGKKLLTTIVQYNKCYYDTYYNHNDFTTIACFQFPVSLQLSFLPQVF